MQKLTILQEKSEAREGSLKSYTIGFLLSLLLTSIAFLLIWNHVSSYHEVFSHPFLYASLTILSIIQLWVQATFFLHLGRSSQKRWNLIVFLLAVFIVGLIVIGSLWIMNHLNYNMMQMSPHQVEMYMINQSSL